MPQGTSGWSTVASRSPGAGRGVPGTDHCTWIGGGVLVVDDQGKPTRADGLRALTCCSPPSRSRSWTCGAPAACATASNDYQVTRQFVPEGAGGEFLRARPVADGPLYRLPFTAALGLGVACVGLGLACALDELVTVAATKKPALSSRAGRARHRAGRCRPRRGAPGRGRLREFAEAWDRAVQGGSPPPSSAAACGWPPATPRRGGLRGRLLPGRRWLRHLGRAAAAGLLDVHVATSTAWSPHARWSPSAACAWAPPTGIAGF